MAVEVVMGEKYNFPVTMGVKVLIRNRGKLLLTREPSEATWMPGRWGLPGGKVLLNESMREAVGRKIKEETGVKCTVRSLFKVVEILMPQKNVYHFVYAADYMGEDKTVGEKFTDGLKWVNVEEWGKIGEDELTEYYLKEVVGEFWEKPFTVAETKLIKEQRSFEDKNILEWMERGKIRE